MRFTASVGRFLGALSVVALTPGWALAQSDVAAEAGSLFQFNFSNPGAKSLGMGGALTGLGDDATGAWTNPAGLLNMSRPEVSFEFRSFDYSTPFVKSGRATGSPTNIGVDTVSTLVNGSANNRANTLSFSSLVVPAGNWAVAAYVNQAARFKATASTDGAFYSPNSTTTARLRPVDGDLDLSVTTFGAAVSRRLSEQFYVGASVSAFRLSLDSQVLRYNLNQSSAAAILAPGGFYGTPLRSTQNVIYRGTQDGTGTKVGGSVGVSWNASEQVRIGASYRRAPRFDVAADAVSGAASVAPNTTLIDDTTHFKVPDVFSVGVMVRPVPELSLVVDFRNIRYSQLVEDFKVFDGSATSDEFKVDNGNEVRAGAEYVAGSVALRGGFWYDPDHRIRFEPKDGRFNADSIIYRPGDSVVHGSGGVGLLFRDFQVDFGVDYSKLVTTVAVSTVIRF
ncbi:MAG: outer membrane protein transport protein [Vicinamibacterales bacterium]